MKKEVCGSGWFYVYFPTQKIVGCLESTSPLTLFFKEGKNSYREIIETTTSTKKEYILFFVHSTIWGGRL